MKSKSKSKGGKLSSKNKTLASPKGPSKLPKKAKAKVGFFGIIRTLKSSAAIEIGAFAPAGLTYASGCVTDCAVTGCGLC